MTSDSVPNVKRVLDALGQVVLGQDQVLEHTLIALLAGGHVLLEDVPGTGKTTLARSLAQVLGLDFVRVQFTADLLPADILGLSIPDDQGELQFQRGPIFQHVILAEELNRTPPRTQSALLEGMNEGQVSIDGRTHELPEPFFVIATQNPLEFAGTYPLPESQLDRFLVRLELGYPDADHEARILEQQRHGDPTPLSPLLTRVQLLSAMGEVRRVHVEASLGEYAVGLAHGTRTHPEVELGASTRAVLALQRAAQAAAWVRGRNYCIPDDFQGLVHPVWGHRLVTRAEDPGAVRGIIQDVLEDVPIPAMETPHGQRTPAGT